MLYINKISKLDKAQQLRFKIAFWTAIYLTLLAPLIVKYQGIYFSTQLITIILILKNLSNKFLEKITEKFILGELYHLLIILIFFDIIVLTYFYTNIKTGLYIYVFYNLIIELIALTFGIKLTSLLAKQKPNEIKKIQIYKNNIWSEGFLIGLFLSLILQSYNNKNIILIALIIRIGIFIYLIKNWNFFNLYFKGFKNEN